MLSARVIIALSVVATALAMPSRAAEKLPLHPKLVYRQIGAGHTLAMESARRDKTFFVCEPDRTSCISTKEVGWRKPFIIIRDGAVISPGFNVFDTSSNKYRNYSKLLPADLKNVPLYPAAIAWEKLSPTRALW